MAAMLLQTTAQTYSGGSGTETDPYLISSNADMVALANAVNNSSNYSKDKHFLLTQDLTGITTVIGTSSTSSYTFQGIFDGGGHSIGISVSSGKYRGIFGNVLGAEIKDLGSTGGICANATNTVITNCYNTGGGAYCDFSSSSDYYSGGICAYATDCTFTDCYNTGAISKYRSGGICAYAKGTTFSNCCNTGAVSATVYVCYSGGICGEAYGCSINDCYNTGGVASSSTTSFSYFSAGGICGSVTGTDISNCYNTGNISSETNGYDAGGICGRFDFTSNMKNCFNANITIQGRSTQSGRIIGSGTGAITACYSLATSQVNGATVSSADATSKNGADATVASLQQQSWITTNLQWDFTDIWYMPSSPGYPLLKQAPKIQMDKQTIVYGETAVVSSNNITSDIVCSASDNTMVEIQANTIKPLRVGSVTISVSQTGINEFKSHTTTFQLAILKKEVAVKANDAAISYGDTPPAFTAQYSGFVNGDTEAVLTTLPAYSCNATSTSNVGTYSIVPSGAVAQNYSFVYETGTLTVSKRALTVTPADASREYGNANPAFTFTYSGFVNGNTASVISPAPTAATTATATSPAGAYPITCSGGAAANYNIAYQSGTLTVAKATLTATADPQSRVYGASNPTFTISYTGFKNSENGSVVQSAPTVTCAATQASPAGDYPIVLNGGTAQNYNLSLINGNLTVTKRALTAKANDAVMTYGNTLPVFTVQYNGFVNGDTEAAISSSPTFICNASSASAVGTYTITPTGAVAQNYSFSYETGTLTIEKRPLTATPNDATRVYGSADPAFTFNYTGFVNGDNASAISAYPVATTTATATSPVGTYPITCSGGSAANYSLNYQTGTLTITKAALTAVADNHIRTYGANNPAFTITYYGFKNSDNQNSLTQAPAAICQASPTSPVGDYPITLTGGNAQNYDFTLMNGTLTVNKATVTVAAQPATSIYGDNPPAFTCQYSGFLNGESESVLTTLPVFNCSGNATSNAGTYPIVPSGAIAQNYSFTYQNGTLTIIKRQLQAIPDNATREYGEANPAFTCSYSGFVNGDNAASLEAPPATATTAMPTSDAGAYDITCSGGSAGNYNFTYGTGVLTVGKAPLTIMANNATRPQGVSNPAFTLSYSGFKNNDTESVLDVLPTAACAANETSPAGNYEITLSGGNDNNYDYILQNGTLEVTPITEIDNLADNVLLVYPNPVCNELYIQSEKPVENITLYNITGRPVLHERGTDSQSINVAHLPQGVYLLRMTVASKVVTKKIVKQ